MSIHVITTTIIPKVRRRKERTCTNHVYDQMIIMIKKINDNKIIIKILIIIIIVILIKFKRR